MSMCDDPAMAAMCATNPVVGAGSAAGELASSAASEGFNAMMHSMAEAIAEALAKVLAFVVTWWVEIPTPTVDATQGPVAEIQRHLAWYMLIAAAVGIVVAAGRLAIERPGHGSVLRETTTGLVQWVVITGAGTAVIALATAAGDAFSTWIIERATGSDLGAVVSVLALSGLSHQTGAVLVIILGLVAILGGLIQALLMFVRSGMLVIVAGVLPLAAAAGISGAAAKRTRDKLLSWTIAFILYKPVAAIVYAAAFWITSDLDEITSVITGLFMIVLATAALPALMRLVTPQVEQLTSGGGGAGAGAAAGTAAATGARMVSMSSRSSSPSGGGGAGQAPGLVNSAPSGAGATAAPQRAASGAGAAAGTAATVGTAGVAGAAATAAGGAQRAVTNTAQQAAGNGGEGPSGAKDTR